MVELERLPLWPDIRMIIRSGPKPVRYEYTALIHTPVDDFAVLKVVTFDIVRDYVSHVTDYLVVELMMPIGDYMRKFYPYRANFEVTIARRPLGEIGTRDKANTSIEMDRYKGIFMAKNPSFKGMEYDLFDITRLNLMGTVELKLQLVDRRFEVLSKSRVYGVYRNTTMKNLLYGIFAERSSSVLIDGKIAVDGIDLVAPSNTQPISQLVIPESEIHLQDLPSYLQQNSLGVYNAGVGTYFQTYLGKHLWFIYPLYDVRRFKTNVKKMVIFAAPQTRLYGIERTYRVEPDVVYIIASGDKVFHDTAEVEFMNKGIGFRMTDAEAIMKKPVVMTEAGPVGSRSRLNNEVALRDRDDGMTYAPLGDRDISANPFAEYSKILQREGARVDLVWQNALEDLVYPGMPCKYVFLEDDDRVTELTGTILYAHYLIQTETPGLASRSHSTTCQMTLHVN